MKKAGLVTSSNSEYVLHIANASRPPPRELALTVQTQWLAGYSPGIMTSFKTFYCRLPQFLYYFRSYLSMIFWIIKKHSLKSLLLYSFSAMNIVKAHKTTSLMHQGLSFTTTKALVEQVFICSLYCHRTSNIRKFDQLYEMFLQNIGTTIILKRIYMSKSENGTPNSIN